MNLDASTPEKLVAQISDWIYAKATNHMPGKAANLALREVAQTIANATLVTPKTQEVLLALDEGALVVISTPNGDLFRFNGKPTKNLRVVRATLILQEED